MRKDKLISFPSLRSGEPGVCGASVVSGILRYYGHPKSEKDAIEEMGEKSKKGGFSPMMIRDYIKGHGLGVIVKQDMDLSVLKKLLDRDIPVILAIQAWGGKSEKEYATKDVDGHYVVAVGYGKAGGESSIILEDPSMSGALGRIFESALLKRWHDKDRNGKIYNRLGIVVHRKVKE